jgi:hypothetical protein
LHRARIGTRQPAKVTPFAGGNEATVRKSAAGDFFQFNKTDNVLESAPAFGLTPLMALRKLARPD